MKRERAGTGQPVVGETHAYAVKNGRPASVNGSVNTREPVQTGRNMR